MCYPFWPTKEGEPLQFNKLIITLQSQVEKLGGYTVRKLEIKEDKVRWGERERERRMKIPVLIKKIVGEMLQPCKFLLQLQPVSFVVTLYNFTEWREHSVPSAIPGVLTMLEDINKVQRTTGNKPITVICK